MKKSNKLFFVLLAVMLATALVVAGCGGGQETPPKADDDSIKIGFLGAKTGGHAYYGIETLKGMKLAADDINNDGGLLDKELVIIEDDHASKQAEAMGVTEKLIASSKVIAIVGDPTTGITKVAAPVAQDNQVVLLSAGAVGTDVVEIGEYIFRNTLLDALAAPAVTKYCAEELGWQKVALVTSTNNDYSVGLSNIFRDALAQYGVEIATEQSITDGDRDFSAQITSIKARDVDGIVFTGYYTEGGLFMKEIRKQGMVQVMVGGDGLLAEDLWKMGEQAVEGSMVYAGFHPDLNTDNPKAKAFIEAYQAANNNRLPDMFAAQGYDAVMLIADAIKAAGSSDPTVYRDVLAQTKDWQGVTGTITFRENREPVKSPVYLLEVKDQQWAVKSVIPVTAD